ncbi:MAG: hypothetical protein H7832_05440 [Magnetococcus sp. DMHC-6]
MNKVYSISRAGWLLAYQQIVRNQSQKGSVEPSTTPQDRQSDPSFSQNRSKNVPKKSDFQTHFLNALKKNNDTI